MQRNTTQETYLQGYPVRPKRPRSDPRGSCLLIYAHNVSEQNASSASEQRTRGSGRQKQEGDSLSTVQHVVPLEIHLCTCITYLKEINAKYV